MPAFFFGHGNPMNAIQRNAVHRGLGRHRARASAPAGRRGRLRALVSPGHLGDGDARAAHDPRLRRIPARALRGRLPGPGRSRAGPGDPGAAGSRAASPSTRTAGASITARGPCSATCFRMPPCPCSRSASTRRRRRAHHYELGRRLTALRDDGVLVVGSGNLVHNLHAYAWGRHPVEPFDWAVRFEARARELLLAGDHGPLVDYETLGRDAVLSVPTPGALPAAALRPGRCAARASPSASRWRGSTAGPSRC